MTRPAKILAILSLTVIGSWAVTEFAFKPGTISWLKSRLASRSDPLAARIYGQNITLSQLDRALHERLWLEGKSAVSLSKEETNHYRSLALEELIDNELLRHELAVTSQKPIVTNDEINERSSRFIGRFESKGALETALRSQGINSEINLQTRLASQIQLEKFLEQRIAPQVKVTEEEARNWFKENAASLANPERVEARHVFLPTLDHPPEEAKLKLEEALIALTDKKKNFAELVKELSEDPATKEIGGALGWMTRDRLPEDFSAPLFSLETGRPALIRTKLGWHLVEITARQQATEVTFEQARPEIFSALETIKRRKAVADHRAALRQSAAGELQRF
jgi:parvulin-like peptidyl-prolyl isomerase